MKSILQSEKECYLCHTTEGLHVHHVFSGWANRTKSEETGMKLYLCFRCHEMIHTNREEELKLKQMAQTTFESKHSREEFRAIFGKSWL